MWQRSLTLACRFVPALARAVGRENFRLYVYEDLPGHVEILGVAHRRRATLFRYTPPFDPQRVLLHRFQEADATFWFLHKPMIGSDCIEPTRALYRNVDTPRAAVWLYLDDDASMGAFVIV